MEFYDVLTIDRKRTGMTHRRGEPLGENEYRSGAEIWVFAPDGRLMITQRHPEKDAYPLYWECTGGLVRSGESTFETIKREAGEEIGVHFSDGEIKFVKTILVGHEYLDVYTAVTHNTEFELQEDEVVDFSFVTDEELKAVNARGEFVPQVFSRVMENIDLARSINGLV